jgi:C4-dicarboxylate-specific signal transduction histidine kinase
VPAGLERQIFVPFFSAREGGQGIGLTVVRQLVNGMGGRVRHVRPIEGGAAFVLSF